MKKVLVTGADGFIGSHLTDALLREGHSVRALAQYNSMNHWGWLEGKREEGLEVVCGDVRDSNFCREIVKGVDTVFHLAALIAIPYSYIAPDSYIDTNIKGTLNICQACRDSDIERLLVTSTSEVYGTARYVPIDEGHPRQPQSPYSASKIGADALAMSFYNSFGLPVSIVRPFNTYGPRQSARAFIPTVITQLASGKREIKTGDLRPTRDFNYVEDTVAGFIAIATSKDTIGKEINICTGEDHSMKETFETICRLMGVEAECVTEAERLRPANSEVMRLCGDNSLIGRLTDWKPRIGFDEGLGKTIEWFTNPENLSKYKEDIYNR